MKTPLRAIKTHLQRYESQTHRLLAVSLLVTAVGIYLFFVWSPFGGVLALIGFAGMIWCFLRR
jgi:FtsH-binding integral membrane protein